MHGDSGFIHNSRNEDEQERACRVYPALKLAVGHLLHVYEINGRWCVWLNCEDMEFTGLCIGIGDTRDIAIAQAVAVLEEATDVLQQPFLSHISEKD